jgi:hypothetical protein
LLLHDVFRLSVSHSTLQPHITALIERRADSDYKFPLSIRIDYLIRARVWFVLVMIVVDDDDDDDGDDGGVLFMFRPRRKILNVEIIINPSK